MKALTGLFDIVPGWIWAALLAAAMATNCVTWSRLDAEVLRHGALKTAVAEQKAEASKTLADETAKALEAERRWHELKSQQEKRDAEAGKKIASLERSLRDAAPAGRLRDPNAAGCGGSGGGAAAAAPAAAAGGATDGAEAGGLLSAELTGLLQRLLSEADAINNAYASCRATLIDQLMPK